ncbi:MAG TPA: NAD-dependent epimerase/dehydratase family protein, partial [Candidatus Polarisedimenticolia bacterium]|nr:NAD-dependent epimerase/dehydratase family protein [Candidatus Polarisedimenticolia bacterium]
VSILDDFSTGHRRNLDAALKARPADAPAPEILEGDLRDVALVRRAVAGVTHVLHQAALPSVPRSVAEPLMSHEVNASGTLGLLLAARDAGVKRFVYASSSSAYGDAPTLPKIESQPTAPLSPYAVSKLAGEQYCRIFTPLYGLETVSLRYFNIFGPRQDPQSQYAAVIPRFVTAVQRGESPSVYGDGTQSRDFTYIDNAVQANLLACDAPASAAGLAYNVACGASATLLEVLGLIGRILNKPVRPVHEPFRAGDVKHSLASIDLARRHLDFDPKIDLEEGLRRTAAAFAG